MQEALFNMLKNGPILCDEMIMTPLTQRQHIEIFLHQLWTRSIGCSLTTTEQFPCVIIAMYHFSEGWTYNIHDMSRKYPKEEIVVNLYQAALHFNITEPYKEFLKASNLQYFLPTDLEQVD